ncbi:HlyD family efflux transporter periplasmic adaptor subunit [Brevundimonas sp. 2R-24]|uniref:HlyD family efflux transporter periplasmic adaptor subunit n=1 Tax=Peiella sedimenti TaxID=3061083 RepID=A0ABT8SK08_9CAUL|nr:HlyD family efflux transporter periplasmic adaptor subunit [Caulobacteraceae bacterium XZ-24]
MNRRMMAAGAVLVLVLAAVAFLLLRPGPGRVLSGYVEGDPLYLSSPVSGTVAQLYVREGARVAEGAPVFLIDPTIQAAQAGGAAAAVGAAEARADDLRQGQRPQELDVFDAELQAALASQRQAEAEYARIAPLVERGIYAPARLDQVRAARDAARAQTAAVRRRREVATLGAREDAIRQADQQAQQARGALSEAQARLRQLSPHAPVAARVEDVFFQPGEWAPANQPIAALLPDDRVRLIFFVPEPEMARYRPGARVRFGCDGCGAPRQAIIRWVSPRPEFTPPVLYSRGSRDRLVYRVEAIPESAAEGATRLNPGLPVDVEPLR